MAPKRKAEEPGSAQSKRPSKPNVTEFVGFGAPALVLNSDTLPEALAHLSKAASNNQPFRELLDGGSSLVFTPAPNEHAAFIQLCNFIVRRQISVASASSIAGKLKKIVGGVWTPQSVLSNEPGLRDYLKSGQSGKKVDSFLALARLFSDESPDLDSMPDSLIVDRASGPFRGIEGVGPVALRVMLVHLGRPNVLVAGDMLVDRFLLETYGIDKDKTDAATERARLDAASAWSPWRSAVYLLLANAKVGSATVASLAP